MKTICVEASNKYDVIVGNGLLSRAGEICKEKIGICHAVIITDSNVDKLYSDTLKLSLENSGYVVDKFVFSAGEESKNSATLIEILEFLAEHELTRSDCIFALGGGVVGDIAGFAAAVYLRGIRFIQIPTTLLAAVDSSVGGKTGIDLNAGKNLAGAFHQPSLVICDYALLNTLSEKFFCDGCAEIIKYGIINDKELFETLENGIKENIEDVITRCVKNKSDIVKADEFDVGARQLLNLGHTVGHAIEKLSNFTVSHGNAVATGIVIVMRAAVKLNICNKEDLLRVISLFEKNNLPTTCNYKAKELATVALKDKKRSGNTLTIVVPYSIGDSRLMKLSVDDLEDFINKGLHE